MEAEGAEPLPGARLAPRLGRAALILATLCGLLLVPVPVDLPALWFGAATDFLHVPIFAALTYALARYCFPRWRPVVIAAAACLAVGAEAVQPLVTRSASWRDAAYGLVGVGIAAAALATTLPRLVRVAMIVALAAWPVWETGPAVWDAVDGWASYPTVADFDGAFSTRRWWLRNAELVADGERGLLHTGVRHSGEAGAVLLPIVRDWRGYDRLEFDFSFAGEPLVLLVSVRTGGKRPQEQAHYDLVERYLPGKHRISIDLARMRPVGNDIPLELGRVQALLVMAYDERPRTIAIGAIELVKDQ